MNKIELASRRLGALKNRDWSLLIYIAICTVATLALIYVLAKAVAMVGGK